MNEAMGRAAVLWRRARKVGFVALATVLVAGPALAQGTAATGGAARSAYSRADLESALRDAERDRKRSAEAALLRARLESGDFSAGDRVVVEVRGDSSLYDTLTVRTGPALRLPNIPDVPLKGVLRSELQDYLAKYLARYIRNPDVRAESLIRLSVLGQVGKPGFYDFNSDILLTDAIMTAGGPTGTAAIERSTIRRGRSVVLSKERVRRAAQSGATLDRLGLRPGDEITVGEKRRRLDTQTVLGIVGAVTSLALTIFFFVRN